MVSKHRGTDDIVLGAALDGLGEIFRNALRGLTASKGNIEVRINALKGLSFWLL